MDSFSLLSNSFKIKTEEGEGNEKSTAKWCDVQITRGAS